MSTVLVVEDDPQIRDVLRLLLTDEGYTVTVADGGMQAIEVLRQMSGHAVVLFDYVMPEGDGLYLLQAVADDKELNRRHAYICMAARPYTKLPDDLQSLMDRLKVPFVGKPFDIDVLVQMVNAANQRLIRTTDAQGHDVA